jgi:5-methylcytosine-specific restriction endonuclease McrA
MDASACELCGRPDTELTRHHLIPRARHKKGQIRRNFDKTELTGRLAMLCRACHKYVHTVLTERQLADEYNTVRQLLAHPEIAKFVCWIAKRPSGLRVSSRRKAF